MNDSFHFISFSFHFISDFISFHFRCAKLVKENGYRFFGLQFYGECWSGNHSSDIFNGRPSENCWSYRPNYTHCDDNSPMECVGKANFNYVYEVISDGKFFIPTVAHGLRTDG